MEFPLAEVLNGLMHKLKKIRMSTFSDANGGQEGENRPLEWKSWNYDETSVSVE
jgi:hypothetical protein